MYKITTRQVWQFLYNRGPNAQTLLGWHTFVCSSEGRAPKMHFKPVGGGNSDNRGWFFLFPALKKSQIWWYSPNPRVGREPEVCIRRPRMQFISCLEWADLLWNDTKGKWRCWKHLGHISRKSEGMLGCLQATKKLWKLGWSIWCDSPLLGNLRDANASPPKWSSCATLNPFLSPHQGVCESGPQPMCCCFNCL